MATISTIPETSIKNRPISGRTRRSERQTPKRSCVFDPNGFLKMKFDPIYLVPQQSIYKIETEFFNSFENVCSGLGLNVLPKPAASFPHNISISYQQLSIEVARQRKSCIITQDDQQETCIAVFNEYVTPYFLNYIPFRPICNIIIADCYKDLKPLVLEISRYLCFNAQFKEFSHGSYAWEIYDRLRESEWEYQDEEETSNTDLIDAIDIMQRISDKYFPEIDKPTSLNRLKCAIKKLKRTPGNYEKWITIGEGFLNLITQYPDYSLRTHIPYEYFKGVNQDELVWLEQWACFYWSGNDILDTPFEEWVQTQLQEKCVKEAPLNISVFNTSSAGQIESLDYEIRLFDLLDQFVCLLNDYDHEL